MLILFQVRPRLQQTPGVLICLRPVFAEDATANLAVARHLDQSSLHRDTNVSASAAGAVAVNQLYDLRSFAPRDSQLIVKPPQGLVNGGPSFFEVDDSYWRLTRIVASLHTDPLVFAASCH